MHLSNCLETPVKFIYYNVARNGKRERLRKINYGQSAAKILYAEAVDKVQRLVERRRDQVISKRETSY